MAAARPTDRRIASAWRAGAIALTAAGWLACGGPDAAKGPEDGPAARERQPGDGLYAQAVAHITAGRLDTAAAHLQRLLTVDPSHYGAHLGLGEIRMRQERFPEALSHLERARALDRSRPEAWLQLGRTLVRLERRAEAIDLLREMVTALPDHVGARLSLADLLMTRAPPDPFGALAQYEEVLQRRPDLRPARAGAAASRLWVGQFERAAAELEALVAETPRDEDLTFFLGTARLWLGQYDRAVEAYRAAVDALPPGSPRLPVRQWNLRVAWRAAHGEAPVDLPAIYRLEPADLGRPSPVHFTDVAAGLGVAKVDRGRGSAWGDFDGDGHLDLFTVGIQVTHALYLGDGSGGFADRAAAAGLDDPRGGWSATAADIDNDGDPDLYATRDAWEGPAPNSLYRNDRVPLGALHFTEVTDSAGVGDPDDSFCAAWADVDGDGRVDLYVADGITGSAAPNKLYLNRRDGAFDERAGPMGAALTGKSLGVAFGDYDADGDPDLYVADLDEANSLLRNEGGARFTDVAWEAGVEGPVRGAYVAFFADLDDDGDLDLFVSAMCFYEHFVESQVTGRAAGPRAHLYRNDGGARFTEVGVDLGLGRSFGSMGAGYGDIDYDGRVDLYLANGGPALFRLEPNILYHNRGDGFADVTESAGVGNLGKGHGVAFADYDDDGDLDLYAGLGGHYPGDLWANSLYRNDGHRNHWIAFALRGTAANRDAIGTRLVLRAGDHVAAAQVSSGDGFGSTNSPAVEFGLGARDAVDAVDVHWPSGRVDRIAAPAVDRVHAVVEPGAELE